MAKTPCKVRFQSATARAPGLLEFWDDTRWADRLKAIQEEDNAKLRLLAEQYGIQSGPDMFRELALALARELCPERKKHGRRAKWTDLIKGVLVVEIERLMRPNDPAHGVEWACMQLKGREPWKSFLDKIESDFSSPDPQEALRQIYYGFRNNRWATISLKAFRLHEHEGTIEDWEQQVSDIVKK